MYYDLASGDSETPYKVRAGRISFRYCISRPPDIVRITDIKKVACGDQLNYPPCTFWGSDTLGGIVLNELLFVKLIIKIYFWDNEEQDSLFCVINLFHRGNIVNIVGLIIPFTFTF